VTQNLLRVPLATGPTQRCPGRGGCLVTSTVRARPAVHLTADDRRFGHRVLMFVAATHGRDTGVDTKAGLPRKAPSSPRAASWAGRRPRACRRPQRGSAGKLWACAPKGQEVEVTAVAVLVDNADHLARAAGQDRGEGGEPRQVRRLSAGVARDGVPALPARTVWSGQGQLRRATTRASVTVSRPPLRAARGGKSRQDTVGRVPAKAPSSPRAASRAGRSPKAVRPSQRATAATLRAFAGRSLRHSARNAARASAGTTTTHQPSPPDESRSPPLTSSKVLPPP